MDLNTLLYGIYPYIVLTVFLLGSWIRFDYAPYTWKSDSSQFLSKRYMRWASNLFHVGILMLFLGHLAGLVTPPAVFHALGISDLVHQYIAIIAGTIFGLMCFTGGFMLLLRRIYNPRIRATSRFMDYFILVWLILTVSVGLGTIPVSLHHATAGDATVMLALASWVQSSLGFNAAPGLLEPVDPVFKLHIFFGLTLFLLFPFSRLVHIWSAPFSYLFRAYQVVRTKRIANNG
ncbi:MAG: respiratory nitrate reductase subunit gamma [Pseudomonadota bacterium]|nr:respiratory nitrate reductase subunit gamma [Pseudomonadota bacterium]